MGKVYMIFGTLDEGNNFQVSLVEKDPNVLMAVLKKLEKVYGQQPPKKTGSKPVAKQT